jgi:hypothetical protein
MRIAPGPRARRATNASHSLDQHHSPFCETKIERPVDLRRHGGIGQAGFSFFNEPTAEFCSSGEPISQADRWNAYQPHSLCKRTRWQRHLLWQSLSGVVVLVALDQLWSSIRRRVDGMVDSILLPSGGRACGALSVWVDARFPAERYGVRPNTLHVILNVMTLATLVVLLLITYGGR